MLIVEYNPNGDHYSAVPDGNISRFVDNIVHLEKYNWQWEGDDVRLTYSTTNIFTALRLAVVEGRIPAERIIFEYGGERIPINEYGALLHWPKGFLDAELDNVEQILKLATSKRAKIREESRLFKLRGE